MLYFAINTKQDGELSQWSMLRTCTTTLVNISFAFWHQHFPGWKQWRSFMEFEIFKFKNGIKIHLRGKSKIRLARSVQIKKKKISRVSTATVSPVIFPQNVGCVIRNLLCFLTTKACWSTTHFPYIQPQLKCRASLADL